MSTRVTATVVCCILKQILCVVSQKNLTKASASVPDLLLGLRPWIPLGFQTPSPPNNPVRSTPLAPCPTLGNECGRTLPNSYTLRLRRVHVCAGYRSSYRPAVVTSSERRPPGSVSSDDVSEVSSSSLARGRPAVASSSPTSSLRLSLLLSCTVFAAAAAAAISSRASGEL